MTTFRWLVAVAALVWCAGATGGAFASDPKEAEGGAKQASQVEPKAHVPKVNINEANQGELMKLEGVGAGTAKKIIAWREAHGPFKHAHDLEKVPGVGHEVFSKNHGRIAVK
jgi:competence ComEA-like helix-hairpin-helix protein